MPVSNRRGRVGGVPYKHHVWVIRLLFALVMLVVFVALVLFLGSEVIK